jgi:hypothetical protein
MCLVKIFKIATFSIKTWLFLLIFLTVETDFLTVLKLTLNWDYVKTNWYPKLNLYIYKRRAIVQIDLRSKSGRGRGQTFWVAPWLGTEPRWNEEPMPNFGVIACVGLAAGCRTHIHTIHRYTLSSLYRRFIFIETLFQISQFTSTWNTFIPTATCPPEVTVR